MGAARDTDPGAPDEGSEDRVFVDDTFDTFKWRLDNREEPDGLMVPSGADMGALQWEADPEVAVFA
jgi:hypothetical protein